MRGLGLALLALLFWLAGPGVGAQAHETRPAFLDIQETEIGRHAVFFKVPTGGPRPAQLELAFDPACETATPPVRVALPGAAATRFEIACSRPLGGTVITIAGLEATQADTLVRIEAADGTSQTLKASPASPSVSVPEQPDRFAVLETYTLLGIEHILLGLDHLLFVAALLFLIPGFGSLAATITSFTIAHSITLALATFEIVTLPGGTVEALIALSIVILALEILRSIRAEAAGTTVTDLAVRKPWIVAFAFGLLHGLGFAGALEEIGLPANEVPLALFAFNVGVEAGQLLFVVLVLLAAWTLRRAVRLPWPALATTGAYLIGGLGSYWLIDRIAGIVA